jgi:hypothetical protein
MITKQQAIDLPLREIHYANPKVVKNSCMKYRRNGQTKTWKTRLEEFKVPIKHGLRDYAYLTHENADKFFLPEECPTIHK